MPNHGDIEDVVAEPIAVLAERELPRDLLIDPHASAIPSPLVNAALLGAEAAISSPTADEMVSDFAGTDSNLDITSFARRGSTLVFNVENSTLNPIEPSTQTSLAFNSPLNIEPHVIDITEIMERLNGGLPRRVDHRRWQTNLVVGQRGRDTCWAFAGAAALEAAYARIGINVKLSEQYLFHISKAHENDRTRTGINSLVGGAGSSDVVHHMKYWYLPRYQYAPYTDQPALQALAASIPRTGGALNTGSGTVEQCDWFEFDLRHIPLNARWFAQYSVATYGQLINYTLKDLKAVIADGHDVVIDVPGHCMLCYGYDDDAGVLLIKNSDAAPGSEFQTMRYTGDPKFKLLTGYAYFIKSVRPPQTQWAAMWVGRWETDHDGWRGRLVIRRFVDIRSDNGIPPPNAPISLGTWYGDNGQILEVKGGFIEGGRGLHCAIGGQPFELYLHTKDPYRAGGRCLWDNTWFGVVMSRGTAVGAGKGFTRNETIGLWDTVHDGWRGQVRIGMEPSYRSATDGTLKPAWITPGPIARQVDLHIDFGGDNRNQHFQLLHHTHEDGLLGGVTQWDARDWPVEGRMSENIYAIFNDGKLSWYRHLGRYNRTFEWDPPKAVGTGWNIFKKAFGGRDGVIYGIRPDGKLLWYYHDGRNQGTSEWIGPKEVGSGWQNFTRVFAGEGGVIYGVQPNGDLMWYRHIGRRDGTFSWQGPYKVGVGWNAFTALAAGPDGTIYGIHPDGRMLWYRHYGHDHGYAIWHGAIGIGVGWQEFDHIMIAGNGFVYGRKRNGELWLWRHHGFQNGAVDWTPAALVGTGWSAGVREVLLT